MSSAVSRDRARSCFATGMLVIVLVAFGVRLGYVAIAKRGPCPVKVAGKVVGTYPSQCAVGDQIFYNAEANTIADGHGFTEPLWSVTHPGEPAPPAADHPPLTVVVLAGVNWLVERPPLSAVSGDPFDSNVREDRYTMVVFGTLLVLLVGLLGRRVGRAVPGVNADVAGLIAAGIAALSPNVWVNDGLVMSETLTGVAVVGRAPARVSRSGTGRPSGARSRSARAAGSCRWGEPSWCSSCRCSASQSRSRRVRRVRTAPRSRSRW